MTETQSNSLDDLRAGLLEGHVIPACPLALTAGRTLDERYQRALVRYYLAAGAGGLAVGVHTTQFAIHAPQVGLYAPVLELVAETARASGSDALMVAGLVGDTEQALREAQLALSLGYPCGLLSLAAFKGAGPSGRALRRTLDALLAHCARVAEVIPLFGFYLQPAVGGRVLPYPFWRRFCEIERVVAIKVAPFDRYQTLNVVRAVVDAGRGPGSRHEIALYTGNDDHIVGDLLTEYRIGRQGPRSAGAGSRKQEAGSRKQEAGSKKQEVGPAARETRGQEPRPAKRGGRSERAGEERGGENGGVRGVHMVGGLLGHWAVWTRGAVELLERCKGARGRGQVSAGLLALGAQVTDCNAAFFDAANGYAGCIAGLHEVLRRQGLLAGRWCLDPEEDLSPGQMAEIDRVYAAYPHLNDDAFVAAHLDEWLG